MNTPNENSDGEHTSNSDDYIDLDSDKLKKLMNEKGLSQEQVGKAMNASRSVVYRVLTEWRIRKYLLERLANAVNTSPENLLRSSSYKERPQPKFETPIPNDWKLVEVVKFKTTAANGVLYCIVKLQHTIIEEKFSRGKFYEFGELPDGGLDALRERLKRHATLCQRMSNAEGTRIARNCGITRLMDDTAWWILDDWIEGSTLKSVTAQESPLTWQAIKHIGTEILLGLDELHSNKIVFRELAPERIYLSNDRLRCTLTDFELAKILQDVPTVAGEWLTRNPYRAPELLEGKTIAWSNYARTDVYSWAAIVSELFTGNPDANLDALMDKLPERELAEFLFKCRSPLSTERPDSVSKVLDVWNKWQANQ